MKRMATLALAVLAAACGRGGERSPQSGADTSAAGGRVNLTGAGATFPYPVYSKWVLEYTRLHPDVPVVLDDSVRTTVDDVRVPALLHFHLKTLPDSRAADDRL